MLEAVRVKNALSALLAANADGFDVIGDGLRGMDAFDIRKRPQVMAVFSGSQPDRSRSGTRAPVFCGATALVKVIACTGADVDLSALKNPDATDEQRAAALSGQVSAEARVTAVLDTAVSAVFSIIMRPANRTFSGGNINLWITQIEYDPLPQEQGSLCLKGAQLTVSYTVEEKLQDPEPSGKLEMFDVLIKHPGESGAQAGATINCAAQEKNDG